MSSKAVISACPKFSAALIAADEAKQSKVSDLTVGRAFLYTESTGGRIRRGAIDKHVRRFRNALFTPIGRVLLDTLTCGTPWMAIERNPNGDIDGDGDVDQGDALLGAIQVSASLVEALDRIHKARGSKLLTPTQAEAIKLVLSDASKKLERTGAAINQITMTTGAREPGG